MRKQTLWLRRLETATHSKEAQLTSRYRHVRSALRCSFRPVCIELCFMLGKNRASGKSIGSWLRDCWRKPGLNLKRFRHRNLKECTSICSLVFLQAMDDIGRYGYE